jgi:hypothetical protein
MFTYSYWDFMHLLRERNKISIAPVLTRPCAKPCGGGHGFNKAISFIYKFDHSLRSAQGTGSRYGRLYFGPISGDHRTFGISNFSLGVLAFSRILNDQGVLTICQFQHDCRAGRIGRHRRQPECIRRSF